MIFYTDYAVTQIPGEPQKVSGCFRTKQGADVYARLQAVVSTLRKQDFNIFAALRDLFSCTPVVLA